MPRPSSAPVPPTKVEYTRRPAELSLVTNTSVTPAAWPAGLRGETTPGVVGKSVRTAHGAGAHVVDPVTYAASDLSTVIALPTSAPVPPRKVEYRSTVPVGSRLVTNASRSPPMVGCAAANEVGKLAENVPPVTKALPAGSTAMASPMSESVPPRYVP